MFYLLKPDRNTSLQDDFERKSLERSSLQRNIFTETVRAPMAPQPFNWRKFSMNAWFWILVFLIPLALMQYAGSGYGAD